MTYYNLIKINLFFILIFSLEANSKTYEKKSFICADEVGPVIEFQVPDFEKNQVKNELTFKLFNSSDRRLYNYESGSMYKKSSPIDTSYFYYKLETVLKYEKSVNLFFEFFPPSTLMLKKDKHMFKTLACWNN